MSYEVSELAKTYLVAHAAAPRPRYQILIEAADNGYLMAVGCRRFVIPTSGVLLELLEEYLRHPWEVEKAVASNDAPFELGRPVERSTLGMMQQAAVYPPPAPPSPPEMTEADHG